MTEQSSLVPFFISVSVFLNTLNALLNFLIFYNKLAFRCLYMIFKVFSVFEINVKNRLQDFQISDCVPIVCIPFLS